MLEYLQHSKTILIKIPLGVILCILIGNSDSGSGDNRWWEQFLPQWWKYWWQIIMYHWVNIHENVYTLYSQYLETHEPQFTHSSDDKAIWYFYLSFTAQSWN